MAEPQLHVHYDPDTDLLMAHFGAPVEADTVMINDDVAVHLSRETGQPVAIEVVACAAKFGKPITAAFAHELLARYGQEATEVLEAQRLTVAALEPPQHTR